MSVTSIHSRSEYDNALKSNHKVVVDFHALWCGPCKKIGPIFEKMAGDPAFASIKFIKVDVDEVEDVAEQARITAMPTFLFLKNGEVVNNVVGINAEEIRKTLLELSSAV